MASRGSRYLANFLWLLTAVALLPWAPQGPFDARDYTPVNGVALDYPLRGALLEPLLAPAHVIMGAPDYRVAAGMLLLWAIALAALVVGTRMRRAGRGWSGVGLRAGFAGVAAGLIVAGYIVALATSHMPGWRLGVDDPDLVVADLQSHTYGSHDAWVAPRTNVEWHRERGYDLVAITEHNDPAGAFVTRRQAGRMSVIPSVEVNSEQEEFLLGLGLSEGAGVLGYRDQREDYARHFVRDIQQRHGGAVLAMAWRIQADQIRRLVEVGVDGFEIANTAHPEIPADVREAMLEAGREGRVLVASTDWHGWGGLSRTWTLVRVPGAAAMTPAERAAAVVNKLRQREAEAFVPVVAGRLEPPSLLRAVLTPVIEPLRYMAELSPARVAGWWLWGLGLLWLATRYAHRGRSPWAVIGGLAVFGIGVTLVFGALRLWSVPAESGGAEYAAELAGQVAVLATVLTAGGAVALMRAWSPRSFSAGRRR